MTPALTAALRKLLDAKRASLTAPTSRDFAEAYQALAQAAEAPAPMIAWACGLVSK